MQMKSRKQRLEFNIESNLHHKTHAKSRIDVSKQSYNAYDSTQIQVCLELATTYSIRKHSNIGHRINFIFGEYLRFFHDHRNPYCSSSTASSVPDQLRTSQYMSSCINRGPYRSSKLWIRIKRDALRPLCRGFHYFMFKVRCTPHPKNLLKHTPSLTPPSRSRQR